MRRPRLRRVLPLLVLLVLAAAAWAGWQVLQASRELRQAADAVRDARALLTADTPDTARLSDASLLLGRADGRFRDPFVRLASLLPVAGDPVQVAASMTRSARIVVDDAVLPLAGAADAETLSRLVPRNGRIDLSAVAELSPRADRASEALFRAQAALQGALEQPARLPELRAARRDLRRDLAELRSVVDAADTALQVAPGLLAEGTDRRYLVLSQSPAEARGTGGLLGGFTVLEVADGTVRVAGAGSKAQLVSPSGPVVDLGPEFQEHYGLNDATSSFLNANLSPHVPYAGQILSALYERSTGTQVDGVVLVDPVALGYLLGAIGPVTLTTGETVTAEGVADLTLRQVYERFPTQAQDEVRDAFLQDVSGSVTAALLSRDLPPRPVVEALSRAVSERRLTVWTELPGVQAVLEDAAVGGALPSGRVVGDVVVDSGESKLQYYLDRSLRYAPSCDGGAPSALALTLTNDAPAQGLPEYVTPERARRGGPPGTNVLIATLYLPEGSAVRSVLQDGQPVQHRVGTELGLVWAEVQVVLPPGGTARLAVAFDEPDTDRPIERLAQPLVRPEQFVVQACA